VGGSEPDADRLAELPRDVQRLAVAVILAPVRRGVDGAASGLIRCERPGLTA
jgi:hypothetical protein